MPALHTQEGTRRRMDKMFINFLNKHPNKNKQIKTKAVVILILASSKASLLEVYIENTGVIENRSTKRSRPSFT